MSTKKAPLVTPRGIAKFPWVNKPDTKFDAEGTYKITLILTGEAADKLRDKIDAELAASLAAAQEENKGKRDKKGKPIQVVEADPPYRVIVDEDGAPTGTIEFSFKVNAIGRSKKTGESWSNKPTLTDAKGKACPAVQVRGGSEVKVAYEITQWFRATDAAAGVSLRLKAVRIYKLSEGGAQYDWGDEGDEDGFDASEYEAPNWGDDDDDAPASEGNADDATKF